jgi:16S rRNA (adenine1518-N6/adenine1519-N6)-dimethyltransferase
MGSLMALTLNYFDSDILCHVPPGAFLPPPKVESLVLSLKRKKDPVIPLSDFTRYEKFLRILFSNKRKQLGKVLKSSYEQEKLEKALKECQIERTLRAETLALTQVQELFSCLAG